MSTNKRADVQSQIGAVIQTLRRGKPWSVEDAAREARVPIASIQQLEAGQEIKQAHYQRILELFGLDEASIDFIVGARVSR